MKKLFILAIVCLLFSFVGFAQQPPVTQEWVQRFNGPDSLFDVGTAIDVFGSVYVTGRTIIPSGERIVVIKYSPSGVQQWASFFAGHQPVEIVLDNSGNAYVTGITSTVTYLTLKYDAAGILQWADSALNTSIPTSIALDLNNNVYVTGSDSSGNRITTIKYNNSGVQQWSVTFQNNPATGSARGNDITVDANGNVYVTGLSHNGTSFDYTTLKYSASGIQQWVSYYNGTANSADIANAIALDPIGNIYVTGLSDGIGTGLDYATIQYDANGVQQWAARYNGPGNSNDLSRNIAVDGFGNINVTGNSIGSGTQDDFATIQYSNAGIQNWIQRYNGTVNSADQANALVVDYFGKIYISGFSANSGTGEDYATLKYDVNGNQQWIQIYNGTGNSTDQSNALVTDVFGNVYVTGLSFGIATNFDIATIKYSQPCLDSSSAKEILTDPFGCNDLFISEYIEGSGKNRALEIFNGSDGCRNLDNYSIKIYQNASANNITTVPLSGILLPNRVFTCCHDQSNATIKGKSRMICSCIDFDGNDAVGLYKNDTLIDMIGQIGNTPGKSGWQVGNGFTKDNTLVRRWEVRSGTQYWSIAQMQYDALAIDKTDSLGQHVGFCTAASKVKVRFQTTSSTAIGGIDHFVTINVVDKIDGNGQVIICLEKTKKCSDPPAQAQCGPTKDYTITSLSNPLINDTCPTFDTAPSSYCEGWSESIPDGFSGTFNFIIHPHPLQDGHTICFQLYRWSSNTDLVNDFKFHQVTLKSSTSSVNNLQQIKTETVWTYYDNNTNNIIVNGNNIKSVEIYNLLGQSLFLIDNVSQNHNSIQIKSPEQGLYLIRTTTINSIFSNKVIVH